MKAYRWAIASATLVLLQGTGLAQDPVKVAATQYKVVAEDSTVRVLEATLAPGAKTAMHTHPYLVAVMLEAGSVRWTMKDGSVVNSQPGEKRGTVLAMDAQSHAAENTGKTTARVILVEFKKPAPAAGKARNPTMPSPFKTVADTPYARVFEGEVAPGQSTPQHTHFSDHMLLSLNDGTAEAVGADGQKQILVMKKDTPVLAKAGSHRTTNTGKTATRVVIVEPK
ncbi:MAG: hypothetical protein ACR2L2_05335 [Acidobacteriota bacterium]